MTALTFDATCRPGLAYQHAFDWLAVKLNAATGPVACLSPSPFQAVELLRRVPQGYLIDPSPATQEVADQVGARTVRPERIDGLTFAAVAWVEPHADHLSRLAQIQAWLRPGGVLYLVVGGPFAPFLYERRQRGTGPFAGEGRARRALKGSGFRLHARSQRSPRLGIHGVRAILWHRMSTVAGRLGRPAWQDRFHYAMRRDFVTRRGPAALVLLAAEIA